MRTGVRVDRLWRDGARYIVDAGDRRIEADHVVVAMATCQEPRVPEFARALDPGIVQLHSREYRNPSQLQPGGVLLVGAGNSGADIALDVVKSHRTWLSGRHPGHVPFRIESPIARVIMPILFRLVFHRILTVDTPMGRRARAAMISKGGPLIRVKPPGLYFVGLHLLYSFSSTMIHGVARDAERIADMIQTRARGAVAAKAPAARTAAA